MTAPRDRIQRTLFTPSPMNLMRSLTLEVSRRIKSRGQRAIAVPTIFDRADLALNKRDTIGVTRVDVEDVRLF